MPKKETFLIRFAKNILKALKIRQIRLYGSKFSKKTYTLYQHIILLALREYNKGIGYRQFCELLPDYNLLLDFIGLKKIPHFTTLHKVSQRLKGTFLETIFLGFTTRAKFRAGIDSTGLSGTNPKAVWEDSCSVDGRVLETFCLNKQQVGSNGYPCPSGTTCQDGACK